MFRLRVNNKNNKKKKLIQKPFYEIILTRTINSFLSVFSYDLPDKAQIAYKGFFLTVKTTVRIPDERDDDEMTQDEEFPGQCTPEKIKFLLQLRSSFFHLLASLSHIYENSDLLRIPENYFGSKTDGKIIRTAGGDNVSRSCRDNTIAYGVIGYLIEVFAPCSSAVPRVGEDGSVGTCPSEIVVTRSLTLDECRQRASSHTTIAVTRESSIPGEGWIFPNIRGSRS